ncbi:unnamed protein product, partial [marine sediment metagenome]
KQWLLTHGLRIIFIIIGYVVIIFVVKLLTRKFVRLVEDEDRSTRSEREKRADTIASTIRIIAISNFDGIIKPQENMDLKSLIKEIEEEIKG